MGTSRFFYAVHATLVGKLARVIFFVGAIGPLFPLPAAAGGHHGHHSQGQIGPQGPVGPQGPQGPQGEAGAAGVDGRNGNDGRPGDAGAPGATGASGPAGESSDKNLAVNVGAAVRWYDWKHVNLNSGYRYDIKNSAHVVDALIVGVKLGKSYEEREMAKLRAQMADYESLLKEQAKLNGALLQEIGKIQHKNDRAAAVGETPIQSTIKRESSGIAH